MNGEDDDVTDFLNVAAARRKTSVVGLLRSVLHVGTIRDDPRFVQLFANSNDDTLALFDRLDYELRVANPGLHYVFRGKYLGYRREDAWGYSSGSERVQVFVSLIPRADELLIVIPVSADVYRNTPGIEILSGRGHHGVGDVAMRAKNSEELERLLSTFSTWLAWPPSPDSRSSASRRLGRPVDAAARRRA